jgi:hypothetical protein
MSGDSTQYLQMDHSRLLGLPARELAAEKGRQIQHLVASCMAKNIGMHFMWLMAIFMLLKAISWPISFLNNGAGQI